jgi:hypothetical protein
MIKTSNKPNLDQMLESYIGLCDLEVLCWMSPNYIEGMHKNLFVMIIMGSTTLFPYASYCKIFMGNIITSFISS